MIRQSGDADACMRAEQTVKLLCECVLHRTKLNFFFFKSKLFYLLG